MAGLNDPSDGGPESLPRPAPTRRATAPAAPKLRDSCHGCAASKVKCNKEKPTCARCAKRGLKCEYFVTKRAGRKHGSRATAEGTNGHANVPVAHHRPQQTQVSNWPTHSSISGPSGPITVPGGMLVSPNLIQPSPRQHPVFPDMMPNMLSPIDPVSAGPFPTGPFANVPNDFEDFFTSPMSFPVMETSEHDLLGQTHNMYIRGGNNGLSGTGSLIDPNCTNPHLLGDEDFPMMDDTVSDMPNGFNTRPRSPPNSHTSPSSSDIAQSFQNFQGFGGPGSNTGGFGSTKFGAHVNAFDFGLGGNDCCCLIRALGLLKQLFPNAANACVRAPKDAFDSVLSHPVPSVQSIIAENAEAVEALTNMLQCSCSQDGYLLALMSLITLKMLGRYAAAAREKVVLSDDAQSPGTKTDGDLRHASSFGLKQRSHSEQTLQYPAAVGGYCVEGEDQGRMAAQLVLNELHRVQRLVNQLGQRLRNCGVRGGMATPSSRGHSPLDGDFASLGPLSAPIFEQFEADLRKRLRGLSLEIVDTLRRGCS